MPLINDVTDSIKELARVKLVRLSISPTTIHPFERATLSWQVDFDGAAGISLRLYGPSLAATITPNGSRQVAPLTSGRYFIKAIRTGLSTVLGSVALDVDTSECTTRTLSEDFVRLAMETVISDILADKPEVRRRQPDSIEVGANGIRMALRLIAEVEDWADPDVNIDALIQLRAQDGQIRYTLASYGFEIDFPWYADFAAGVFFPAWIAAALEEGSQSGETRDRLTRGIERVLAAIQSGVDGEGMKFLSVVTEENGVTYTICPVRSSIWSNAHLHGASSLSA